MEFDIVIIGAGPAGLNMARAAAQADATYVVIERDMVGGAWRKLYPQMKMLSPATPQIDWTSLPGLDIWQVGCERPFPTRTDFINYLQIYAEKFKLRVQSGTEVRSVSRHNGSKFDVETSRGKVSCRRLIVATGIISNPYIPENLRGKPGVAHAVDYQGPKDFEGKKVLVLGGGNSAAEIVISLAGWASEITLAHPGPIRFHSATKQPEDIRGASESLLRELLLFGIVRHFPDSILESFDGKTARVSGRKIDIDVLIAATGYHPHINFLDHSNLNIKRLGNFPALNLKLESTTEPGIFFTGSITNIFPYSNFIHGFRDDPNGIDLRPDMY